RMKRKSVPAREIFAELRKDPEYVAEYDALAEQCALIEAVIAARSAANLTQALAAERMHSSLSDVARLEGARIHPTIKALKRYAEATGTKLRFNFVRDPQ